MNRPVAGGGTGGGDPNKNDTPAPKTPAFSAPCGACFFSAGDLMSHVQNCSRCKP